MLEVNDMRAIFIMLLVVVGNNAIAATIGQDCSPSGLINMANELMSPIPFWTSAMNEIDVTLKNAQDEFNLVQLVIKNDKIRANLEADELRAQGIPQNNDPQLNRELAEIDRSILKQNRDGLFEVQQWATKCRRYANQKLGK